MPGSAVKTGSRFRHQANRQMMLASKHDLDEVTRKSLEADNMEKDVLCRKPLPQGKHTLQLLAKLEEVTFSPSKISARRKDSKAKFLCKLESSKLDTARLTTNEPQKAPHQDSHLLRVPGEKNNKINDKDKGTSLAVLVQGTQLNADDDEDEPILIAIQQANLPQVDVRSPDITSPQPSSTRASSVVGVGKPAILSAVGTLQPATMIDRKAPVPRRRSRLRQRSSKQTAGDDSGNHMGSGDGAKMQADHTGDAEAEAMPSRVASSTHTVKSTKDLLEEARQITSPRNRAVRKNSDDPSVASSSSLSNVVNRVATVEKWKSVTRKHSKEDLKKTKGIILPDRTVDEIIASLREPETAKLFSESNQRIQAIMDSVLKRNVVETPAEEEANQSEVTTERQPTPVDDLKASSPVDERPQTVELVVEDSEKASTHYMLTPALSATTLATTPGSTSLLQQALDELSESRTEVPTMSLFSDESDSEKDDLEQARQDLTLPLTVSHSDILSVNASSTHLHPRPTQPPVRAESSISLMDTWPSVQAGGRQPTQTVHHLCVQRDAHQLPEVWQGVWRRYHAPGRHGGTRPFQLTSEKDEASISPHSRPVNDSLLPTSVISATDNRQMATIVEVLKDTMNDASMEEWHEKARNAISTRMNYIQGEKISLQAPDVSLLYWSPAPPKWQLYPNHVRDTLCPQYRPLVPADGTVPSQHPDQYSDGTEMLGHSPGDEREDEEEAEITMTRARLLTRQHNSSSDLSVLMRSEIKLDEKIKAWQKKSLHSRAEEEEDEGVPTRTTESRLCRYSPEPLSGPRPHMTQSSIEQQRLCLDDVLNCPRPRRRTQSAPAGMDREDDDFLLIYHEFTGIIDELAKQRKQLSELNLVQNENAKEVEIPAVKLDEDIIEEEIVLPPDDDGKKADELKVPSEVSRFESKSKLRKTPVEKAVEAGRQFVILPKKNHAKKKKKKDKKRVEMVAKFKAAKPRPLERSSSAERPRMKVAREFLVSEKVRTTRRGSQTSLLDFVEYRNTKSKLYPNDDALDDREWVRAMWNRWFDTVFPATPPPSDWGDTDTDAGTTLPKAEELGETTKDDFIYPDDIEVEPIIEDLGDEECIEMLVEEIARLSASIQQTSSPFQLCRRGAILRKLGRIKPALDDLNAAVKMEPLMLNAYWHRHLVYVLQNRYQPALDDLAFILKHNKKHAEAYRSRAHIYKQQSDTTMAIINFTQVIKLCPKDDEAYFQRAEMYEKQGDTLLAMEDYSIVTRLNPGKTEALFRHGMHYYNNGTWNSAIKDLTDLSLQDPEDPRARLYRGLAFIQLSRWADALEDLTAAIHLDPANPVPFYHRACLLRKSCPKRALLDYSVSLLLDDSFDNINAYLHRAILYNSIGRHLDAIADFEALLKIDQEVACAHCMLGLIYMNSVKNIHRAVKMFTNAIQSDPTYIKAYICRAEAYVMLNDYKHALLDFTRAIHLKPDVQDYYMYRGQMLMKLGRLELAAFCVRHAAQLTSDIRGSAMQQAIVQTFLHNYDKAIDALTTALRSDHSVPLYILLGKTQMKARLWSNAIKSIQTALDIMEPPNNRTPWPAEAAEMFHLKGTCHKEMMNFNEAQDAFNNTIRVNPKYAEAYYQRGLARLRLRQSKAGIQDLNKALSLDPTLYQVYLSRAAYYGLRGRYTKAILSCNEAAKLQPNSIRAYLYRGALKYHIKAYQLAILDLTKAISFDNKCSLAYFNRAICHNENGECDKALQDYGIVMLLGDDLLLKALINRSLLYFEQADYHNALCDLLIATHMDIDNKHIHHMLGRCFHKLNRLENAVHSFTRAIELDRFFFDAYIARGNTFMDFGHKIGHRVAKHDYERVLHMLPQCLPARVNLAYNLQMSGRFQQAWHQFTTVIELDPMYQPALEGRAIVSLQMRNTFAAFQDISASIRVRPTAELLTNRGVIHQFMNEERNAMHDFQQAVKLDPTFSLAYFNAANIYLHMRQFVQARDYYEKAIKYNPNDESVYLNSAITKVMLRDTRGALSDFKRAAEISPHSAHIYMNRANLYASINKYQQAENDYTTALLELPDDPAVLMLRGEVRGKLGKKKDAIADYRRAVEIQSAMEARCIVKCNP